MKSVNKEELARRVAYDTGYAKKDILEVFNSLADIIEHALDSGEDVKFDSLFALKLRTVEKKRAYDGINQKYFDRPKKVVVKPNLLGRLKALEKEVEED